MEKPNLRKGLSSLGESLNRLRADIEWLSLKESERRRGDPAVLTMNPDVATSLRNEFGFFMKTATDIHEILNKSEEHGLRRDHCERWRRQLLGLETELNRLNLPQRF